MIFSFRRPGTVQSREAAGREGMACTGIFRVIPSSGFPGEK